MVNCDPGGTFRAQEFMKCHGGALLCFYYVGHLKYENVLYKILVLLSQKKMANEAEQAASMQDMQTLYRNTKH